MALILDWKKKLGYKNDPFTQEIPKPAAKFLVGLDDIQEQFNLFLIKEYRFGTIKGDNGQGKTMFLRWVDESLQDRKYRAEYIDAKETKNLLEHLIGKTTSTLSRKFSKSKTPDEKYDLLIGKFQKKRYVLLIDNAGSLSKADMDFLNDVIDKTTAHIVLADEKDRLKKLSYDSADKLKAELPEYTHEQLTNMLERRIESVGGAGTFPFDEKTLKDLTKKCKGNPSMLLELAREKAIELSLRVRRVPKPAKAASAPRPADEKRIGFLGIRIERGEESQPDKDVMSDSAKKDSEMLEKITDDTDYDKAISEIASKFDEKK